MNLILALVVGQLAPLVGGALEPREIAILAAKGSEASQEVARHYARARQVPETHILLVDLPRTNTLSRRQWEESVRPAIRAELSRQQLAGQVRCLVTVWDVPLKIDRIEADSPEYQDRLAFFAQQRRVLAEQAAHWIETADEILPPPGASGGAPLRRDLSAREYALRFQTALTTANQRLQAEAQKPAAREARAALEKAFVTATGIGAFVQSVERSGKSDHLSDENREKLALLKGQNQGLQAGVAALRNLRESAARDQQLVSLLLQSVGVLGTLAWVESEQALLDKNETYASFDSELALLHWPEYALVRWQPNVLHYSFDETAFRKPWPTLMVARLEAPTVELAKRLVDDAIATEAKGLAGKLYLDARGKAFDGQKASPGDYDESLRNLASVVQTHTKLAVRLDNEERLFAAGSCPQAGLYCGWYSLANYVDAFDWTPGAVGFHIASSEAATLRDPASNVWCKRMIEDGVCATLGPVFEPYLAAFPRPEDFFVLLLSGRFTLAECYYRTLPFNSWAMVLVGDPLYNPFKTRPQFTGPELPPGIRRLLDFE